MLKIYRENGLPFFNEDQIEYRNFITRRIASSLKTSLREQNRAWVSRRIESPCLIPANFVSSSYTAEDVFLTDNEFALKPETTAASYEYAKYLIERQEASPPLCVWQLGKSFRRENDQVGANVRLKEFYQLEFQCIVTADTKNNYQETVLPGLSVLLSNELGRQTRIVESDRLPSYSKRTLDIEVQTPHKWLEVMSCSFRTDVPFQWNGKELINYEFAFGADRLVYVRSI